MATGTNQDFVSSALYKGYNKAFLQITKMEMTSYNMQKSELGKRKVGVNPESYTRKFSTRERDLGTKIMAAGREYSVKIVEFVETLAFELFLDCTGAIPNTKDVQADLDWLEKNLVRFDGDIHATRFIRVVWGPLNLFGQLKSLDITYLYFNQDGTPLRAKASVSFEQVTDQGQVAKLVKSPDLTHLRTVQAGESLPLLCHKIYHDPKYYVQVAKANHLAHFTHIEPGQKIYFPPLI